MRVLISQLVIVLAFSLAAGAVSGARGSAETAPGRTSALKRLGYFLQSERREVRLEFAVIAVQQMIGAYERELDKLNTPARHSPRETRKRLRWAAAVNQYLDYLYAFEEVITEAPQVQIIADQPGPVQLLSGEFLLPIATPRIARPGPLENAIIQAFCRGYACDPRALEDPVEQAPAPPRSGWSFRAGLGSTYQTVDGLSFMFSNVRNKALKERLSQRISAQLRRLGEALARARQRGRAIDWAYLKIQTPNGVDGQRVLLSPRTPALRLALPDLARAEGVLEIAKPWLRARLAHKPIEQFFPGADLLFARLMKNPG